MSGQFGAAGGIKSVQRGAITATTNGTGTVTVSSVDMQKSMLLTSVKNGQATYLSSSTPIGIDGAANLTASDTITWYGGFIANPGTITDSVIYWQLVEYN